MSAFWGLSSRNPMSEQATVAFVGFHPQGAEKGLFSPMACDAKWHDEEGDKTMQLQDEKIGNVLVVKPLEKRMDATVAVDFKEKMAGLINAGNDLIVLDLSAVSFMDSSGLGAMVSSLKMLGRKGDLVVSGVHQTVMSMFKLTRMDRVFRIFSNQDEAVAALAV